MRAFRQFGLLFWKNWLLQRRSPWLTVFEIGLPTLFALILVLIRQEVEVTDYITPRTWDKFTVDDSPVGTKFYLNYAPDTNGTRTIMKSLEESLKFLPGKAFASEEALVKDLTSSTRPKKVWGGIVFTSDLSPETNGKAKIISYKIRPLQIKLVQSSGIDILDSYQAKQKWFTERLFPSYQLPGPRSPMFDEGGEPSYWNQGFLVIQNQLDKSIAKYLTPPEEGSIIDDVEFTMQRLPYPPYQDDVFVFILQVQFPFILMLSFIVTAPSIAKDVVLEKERKLKEFMKMMGLQSWLHWGAWFAKYTVFMSISVVIMVILFCTKIGPGAVIGNINPIILFLFLMLYSISTISFCFAVSVFFKKANSGAAAGGILFFMTYVPVFFFQLNYEALSFGGKWGTSLLHNGAMYLGCVVIAQYEGTGAGVQWSNFAQPSTPDENFTMLYVFIMLIGDTVFYGLITWYFDNIMPGDFGIPKPWYFPFTKMYWCGGTSGIVEDVENSIEGHVDSDYFELESQSMSKKGVKIRNLRKEFTRGSVKNVAVKGTYLDINEDQITALLGHNGAGKTTTMSMLTGFLPPTSGTAIINGYDIRHDIDEVRKTIGLCPQQNILYDTLTVKEHLLFYSKLKGTSGSGVDKEVNDMLSLLHLEDKTNVYSKSLSGGMKRKLHCGIALVGGSKIIMLDEPTSGMDPEARRQMWDILQSQRQGRTMILSTHFMDEADLLGDRIAIMANGRVKCFGSSMFLKAKYGVGYHMAMVKNESCDVKKVTETVLSHVPTAQLESNVSAELSYILPSECVGQFEALFTVLEENKDKMGISSFGASVTTMEEVFLKVGEEAENEGDEENIGNKNNQSNGVANQAFVNGETNEGPISGYEAVAFTNGGHNSGIAEANEKVAIVPTASSEAARRGSVLGRKTLERALSIEERWQLTPVMGEHLEKHSGASLFIQQFYAMFVKRAIHSWRNRVVTLTQLLVPIFFTIMAGIALNTIPKPGDPPSLALSLNQMPEQHVAFTNNNMTYPGLVDKLTKSMSDTLEFQVDGVMLEYINGMEKYQNDTNLTNYIGDIALESLDNYNRRYTFGAELEGGADESLASFNALFNNQGYHAIAFAANVFGNTLLNMVSNSTYVLEAYNHPAPKNDLQKAQDDVTKAASLAFMISSNVQFGMSFLIGTFALFIVKERTVKAKHIQFVSGVHVVNFWLSTFCWDFLNYLLAASLLLPVFAAFDFTAYVTEYNAFYVFLMLVLYGWSVLPCTYLMSFLFSVPSSGYVWTTVFNMFTGIAAVMAVFILRIPQLGLEHIGRALEWTFYAILPNFSLGNALTDMYNNYENKKICTSIEQPLDVVCFLFPANPCCPNTCSEGGYCATYNDNFLGWEYPGIGRALVFTFAQGFVFFCILLMGESGFFSYLVQMIGSSTTYSNDADQSSNQAIGEDQDVIDERIRVEGMSPSPLEKKVLNAQGYNQDSLILKNLRKWYGDFLAVDRLSVGVPQGECFGLLGVNGAGKTSTFRMLTGDSIISSGDAYLYGYSVKNSIKQVQSHLGYCPQFDALIDQMTVRETLIMFGRLRGVNENQLPRVVQNLVEILLLGEHIDKQAGDLSGGNKRKLSTAIALIGDPPVIFLDEPSTGMDPVARRRLWDALNKVRASGRTLVLTSHSMEECEALCTRLSIMVNGQFKCLGSPQHLKAKFGEGYALLVKVTTGSEEEMNNRTSAVMNFINTKFPGSLLKDIHQGYICYQILTPDVTWASLFGTMERSREQLDIEDYSVSQTTLEQVFINFARAQLPPREGAQGCGTKLGNCCKFFFCGGCCQQNRRRESSTSQVTKI